MRTVEECRTALAKLTARLSELDAADRAAYFADRTFSCRVPDLDVVFTTRFGAGGAPSGGHGTAATGQDGTAATETAPGGTDGSASTARHGATDAGSVRLAGPDDPPADVRLTADSDTVVELAGDLRGFPRAVLSGRVQVQARMTDLFRLRKLL